MAWEKLECLAAPRDPVEPLDETKKTPCAGSAGKGYRR
jgi:hypothetical protein